MRPPRPSAVLSTRTCTSRTRQRPAVQRAAPWPVPSPLRGRPSAAPVRRRPSAVFRRDHSWSPRTPVPRPPASPPPARQGAPDRRTSSHRPPSIPPPRPRPRPPTVASPRQPTSRGRLPGPSGLWPAERHAHPTPHTSTDRPRRSPPPRPEHRPPASRTAPARSPPRPAPPCRSTPSRPAAVRHPTAPVPCSPAPRHRVQPPPVPAPGAR